MAGRAIIVTLGLSACGHATRAPAPKPRPVLPPLVCQGLCGRVVWPDGAPAYEVAIVILRPGGGEEVRVTGEDGVFDFAEAPIGTYTIAVNQGMRRLPDVAVTRTADGPQQLPEIQVPHTVGCTLLGCDDGIGIELRGKTKTWPSGTYVFRLVLDAETVECTGTIPLPACGTPDIVACSENKHRVSMTTGACAQRQSFEMIRVAKPADAIAVEVLRDGVSLGRASYRPTYTVARPNGPEPECGSCTNADDVTLKLAW